MLAAGPSAVEGPDVHEHYMLPLLGQVVVVKHLEGVPAVAVHGILNALPHPAQLQVRSGLIR
jgi:hypothetical protein